MMAIKASLAGSRADCVRERLRDCGPGAMQQRQARERSGIAGRRTVEEEKHEKGDAGQQGEPGDRHMPSQVASEEATRSFYAQAGSLLRSCGSGDAQAAKRRLLATRRCEVF